MSLKKHDSGVKSHGKNQNIKDVKSPKKGILEKVSSGQREGDVPVRKGLGRRGSVAGWSVCKGVFFLSTLGPELSWIWTCLPPPTFA